MKKPISITIITLFLLVPAFTSYFLAKAEAEGSGSNVPIFAQYFDGSGTKAAPWQIAEANDLLYLAAHPNDYDNHFILTADINLAGHDFNTAVIAPDTSISADFQGTAFTGTFDGNDHMIFNLTIDTNGAGKDYLGLFGQTNSASEIKNLGINDVNITGGSGSESIGGLVGENNDGSITNCYATGFIAGADILGGLIGESDFGDISNCYADVKITGGSFLGGLLGGRFEGTIINCYAAGSVIGEDYSIILGGLVGYNEGEIINSHASGVVSAGDVSSYLGGMVGSHGSDIISNCYAIGNVTAGNDAENLGGLVGENMSSVSNCYATGDVNGGNGSGFIGGLVGFNYDTVGKCYSVGDVNGTDYLGGLIGFNDSGDINDCLWDIQTSDTNDGVGNMDPEPDDVIGKTTAQMQTQSTFTDYGWDFIGETNNGVFDYWEIRAGFDYPRLSWQPVIPGDIVGSYRINLADYAVIANAWRSEQDDDNWNILCNLYPDNVINWRDLQILAENWLEGL